MSEISPSGSASGPQFNKPLPKTTGTGPSANGQGRPGDETSITPQAHLMSRLADVPDIRQDLVDRVREEIRTGNIDTPYKMEQALENLIQDEMELPSNLFSN